MHEFFKKICRWFRRRVVPQKTMDSELQQITKRLISRSIGPRGKVTRAFREQSSPYNAETNPIGREEALNLLVTMVKLTVAERGTLEGTIVDRVERGLLYSDYYREVEKISDMAVKTDMYYRSAEAIRADYLIEYNEYLRNRIESHRHNSKVTLSEDDLEELKRKVDKINRYTGFGGDTE